MSRAPRLQAADVLYHVGSRGVDRQSIFGATRFDREIFLGLLDRVVRNFGWRCHAYCLMGNHFHLVVDTPGANISSGMQYLKGAYAQWFNRVRGREGTLFERRFWDRIAASEAYVLELARYIVLNPVRAGWADSPDAWPWSSYAATAGLEPAPPFLCTADILDWFGGGAIGRTAFVEFVYDGIGVPLSAEADRASYEV